MAGGVWVGGCCIESQLGSVGIRGTAAAAMAHLYAAWGCLTHWHMACQWCVILAACSCITRPQPDDSLAYKKRCKLYC
jgi:hypothetical protein